MENSSSVPLELIQKTQTNLAIICVGLHLSDDDLQLFVLNLDPLALVALLVPCILRRHPILQLSSQHLLLIGEMRQATTATGLTLGRDVEETLGPIG